MEQTKKEISSETSHLVSRCRQGDHASFKVLYHLFSKPVFNACLRILGNRQDAEDVLQDTFITAHASLGQLENDALFGGWLRSIAINKSLDLVRKRSRDTFKLVDEIITSDTPGEEEPDDDYSVDEILTAHAQLPDGYRIITGLFLFEQLSHKDIADKLNISEGTSKSQYKRGKARLIQLIQHNKRNHAR